jgi:hypothetical protein
VQKIGNYDPDRIAGFVHQLKCHVELGNFKAIYKDVGTLIPEMTGQGFEEMRKDMFA